MTDRPLPLRVLWADDQEEIISALAPSLDNVFGVLRTASNADETVQTLRSEAFDVLILDLQMPPGRWGGLDVLREIGPPPLMLPVVVLSGVGTVRECTQAVRMGAMDYVEKEMASTELLSIVERAVTRWRNDRPLTDYDVVRRLEQRIQARVVEILTHQAVLKGERDFFMSIVPREISLKTYERMLDHKGDAQQTAFLDLLDLKKIIDALWTTAPELQALEDVVKPRNKEGRTRWLGRLNEMRKVVAHPMRGELDDAQRSELRQIEALVNAWLNETARDARPD